MGSVIPRSASPDRIVKDYQTTLGNARRASADIKAAAEARLGPLEQAVISATHEVDAHSIAFDELDSVLLSVDGSSDLEIGAVLDEIWNALGRPQSSIEYTFIAGPGKDQWTDADPRTQPTLMAILAKRIRTTTAFALQAGKEGWATRIEAKAAVQQPAAKAVTEAEATLAVSTGILRSVADLTQIALTRLKRDYQNLGMTETQIHDIIPSYEPKPKAPGKGGKGGGTPTDG